MIYIDGNFKKAGKVKITENSTLVADVTGKKMKLRDRHCGTAG